MKDFGICFVVEIVMILEDLVMNVQLSILENFDWYVFCFLWFYFVVIVVNCVGYFNMNVCWC